MINTKPHSLTMRIKATVFWLSSFAIALFSIIISLYTISPSGGSSIAISSPGSFNLALLNKLVKQRGVRDFLSRIAYIVSRHHHHRRKPKRKCDTRKWQSRLISVYKVSLVLTVDSKGCANFSSVQKAVDAVPDYSPAWTLIIIASGTYRSHTKFSTLYSFLFFLLNILLH